MSLSLVLALAALVFALLLAFQAQARLFPAIAAVVAAVEVLIGFGVLRLSISGIPLGLVLAIMLAIAGALCWSRVQGKVHVSAATVILIVGATQVVSALSR